VRLLPENLLEAATQWPDACAIQQGERRLSFAELAARAGAIANWLRHVGVQRGDRVALLAEASGDYVAAYYGTLMMGAVTVALNVAARVADIAGWIEHSGAAALFLDGRHPDASALAARLPPRLRVLATHAGALAGRYDDVAALPAEENAPQRDELRADALAALIYTSGTTGKPKAVMLSHGNLAANTEAIVPYLGLTHTDSIVSVLPFYYSYGNSVLHTHIASGARIVIGPSLVYPHLVAEALAREAATGFAGVPSTFALLAARVPLDRYDFRALRYVTQAGGPMTPALTERLLALLPRARLYVMYGQTEASARLSYVPPERLREKLGSIGIPIPGVELDVRDEAGASVRRGATGEVWARGPNVMLGYWNDEAATERALVGGWLRTGDMGRLDHDGYLYLEGRRGDIIKVGAHRVFPGDVEAVVEALPGVREVVAVGVDDAILGQVVKVCVVRSGDAPVQEADIKAHCKANLANYKIPKFVEFLDMLPRTASGKVQRHLLTTFVSR
jgi:long-chain acyl-CoA synthetase